MTNCQRFVEPTPRQPARTGHRGAGRIATVFCFEADTGKILWRWQNRSFFFDRTQNSLFPNPAGGGNLDLLVAGVAGTLHPTNCLLTSTAGYLGANNIQGNPRFVDAYLNDLLTAVVIDEAGNNISVRLAPISIFKPLGAAQGNYHIRNEPTAVPPIVSPAINAGASIIPPTAPNLTVVQSGPLVTGTAPPVTGPVTGPGVAPGPAMAPLSLNPLPGDPSNPLLDPNPLPPSPSNDYAVEANRPTQKVTSLVTAKQGQRILLRLSNVSETDIHTLTVLGIPMRVVAKDARLLRGPTGKSLAYNTTSVKMGGGETTDVILDTTSVAPGTYLLYASRLNHLSNDTQDYGGLMTEIVITAP